MKIKNNINMEILNNKIELNNEQCNLINLKEIEQENIEAEINNILNEYSDDEKDENNLNNCNDDYINNNININYKVKNKSDYYYINDIIKKQMPIEYEDNNIYPKVYCYEPNEFQNLKKKIRNKNELRHYDCYTSTMDSYIERFNDDYNDILKNENLKNFVQELWINRSNIRTESEYRNFCIKLRKKYKISPSKHQIAILFQYYHLQQINDNNNNNNNNNKKNLNNIKNNNNNNNNINNNNIKDVKYLINNIDKMIITKETQNYKDIDKYAVNLLEINKKKAVRSNSGVLVITIITHPHKFSCKYDCYYCPNEPNQPRSYLSTEPAILRANQNNFDAVCQFFNRMTTLINNGHIPDKIEILVLGGTFSCYSIEYQEEFIRDIYYAANVYPSLKKREKKYTLEKEQEINEKGKYRIIGLTLETRPDQINKEELMRLRRYGCTRVQIGIQHTDDFILKKVNRQCTLKDAINAIYLLKENAFKVDIHLMPDLPYSNVVKDIEMFQYVLSSIDLQADQWKIYPCEVTPFTQIEKWYNNNKYKPYFEIDKRLLICLIFLVKKSVHPWIRLNRVIRDIPNPSIIAGNNITNMRQLILREMNIRNIYCQCIRCKEIKNQEIEKDSIFLKIYKYNTIGGDEYFITFQGKKKNHLENIKNNKNIKIYDKDKDNKDYIIFNDYDNKYALLGFIRLRLRYKNNYCDERPFKCLENAALIRELHVYGSLLKHDDFKDELNFIQHKGLGKCLILVAELIAFHYNFKKIAVIAGIGTKEYYKKVGYSKEETYMTKNLKKKTLHENYLLHFNKIGQNLVIRNYNLKYSLKLMHETISNPYKNKRTELNDLCNYINNNIISLDNSKYLNEKYTVTKINVENFFKNKKDIFLINIKQLFNKIQKFHFIFYTSSFLFFGITFLSSFHFLKNRKINL